MNSSAPMDCLNDTPALPELSFDDLIDESPVKKNVSNVVGDPLNFDNGQKTKGDELLNTPRPKKKTVTSTNGAAAAKATLTMAATTKVPANLALSATFSKKIPSKVSTPTTAAATKPLLLNNRNLLSKIDAKTTQTVSKQFIKIVPKTSSTTSTTSIAAGTATTTIKTIGSKTAVKTANGQIIYLQKTGSGQLPIRLQSTATKVGATLTNTTITTSTSTPTAITPTGNKTVSIQVIRTADGTLLPVKSTATSTASATALGVLASTKSGIINPPTTPTKLADKRIVSTAGGHVYIKAPLKTISVSATTNTTTLTTINTSPSTTSTSAYSSSSMLGITFSPSSSSTTSQSSDTVLKNVKIPKPISTTGTINTTPTAVAAAAAVSKNTSSSATTCGPVTSTGGRIIVQSANGKQIVVSNQNLVKLSPKPSSPIRTTTTATTTSAAGLQTIRLTGKRGVQYVRVLPATTKTLTGNGTTTPTNISQVSTLTTKTTAANTQAATTSNAAPPTLKYYNNLPQKFTVVRPSAGHNLVLKHDQGSSQNDGDTIVAVPVTLSPTNFKVQQKNIVTLPTLRPIGDNKFNKSSAIASLNGPGDLSLVRKRKISELNSEIKRTTDQQNSANTILSSDSSSNGSGDYGGPSEVKRVANAGNRVVLMSSASTEGATSQSRTTSANVLQPRGSILQRVTVRDTNSKSNSNNNNKTNSNDSKQSSSTNKNKNQLVKKCYSVIKLNDVTTGGEVDNKLSLITQKQQENEEERVEKEQLPSMTQQQQLIQHKSLLLKRPVAHVVQQQLQTISKSSQPQQLQKQEAIYSISSSSEKVGVTKFVSLKIKEEPDEFFSAKAQNEESGGLLRRKHCNCSKSRCLKLYCDCFANGEFCKDCTCKDCFNNLENEDERQRAIKLCLERNPSAFKPKITTSHDQGDMRLHNKGCNCKRSGCLKNYCECYEAKIPCSSNCKCVGCRNIEDRPDLDMDPFDSKVLTTIANVSGTSGTSTLMGQKPGTAGVGSASVSSSQNGTVANAEKAQCNFITQEVIDATIQCMISQADECEKNGLPAYQTEKMVMEELGRCLVEIIDFSIRNTDTSYTQD